MCVDRAHLYYRAFLETAFILHPQQNNNYLQQFDALIIVFQNIIPAFTPNSI